MEYINVKTENKIGAIENRIAQLEAEHYSNEVYLIEAQLYEDHEAVNTLKGKNIMIERVFASLNAEKEKLQSLLPDLEPDNDSSR